LGTHQIYRATFPTAALLLPYLNLCKLFSNSIFLSRALLSREIGYVYEAMNRRNKFSAISLQPTTLESNSRNEEERAYKDKKVNYCLLRCCVFIVVAYANSGSPESKIKLILYNLSKSLHFKEFILRITKNPQII